MQLADLVGLGAVGALLAFLFQGLANLVFGTGKRAGSPGWRGVYYVTMWAHPMLAGAALGYYGTSLPAPLGLGAERVGRVIWYALAGALSPMLYDAVQGMIKHKLAKAGVS